MYIVHLKQLQISNLPVPALVNVLNLVRLYSLKQNYCSYLTDSFTLIYCYIYDAVMFKFLELNVVIFAL